MGLHSATLFWDKNVESDLAGYRVYRGTNPLIITEMTDVGLTTTPLAPSYTFPVLPTYEVWYFKVTAYDTAVPPNESLPSAIVSKQIIDDGPSGGFCS